MNNSLNAALTNITLDDADLAMFDEIGSDLNGTVNDDDLSWLDEVTETGSDDLAAEMDKACEAVANAGGSVGMFKQSGWYNDRREQLAARIAREIGEVEALVRDVEGRNPTSQSAKDRWSVIAEKAAFVRTLQSQL